MAELSNEEAIVWHAPLCLSFHLTDLVELLVLAPNVQRSGLYLYREAIETAGFLYSITLNIQEIQG